MSELAYKVIARQHEEPPNRNDEELLLRSAGADGWLLCAVAPGDGFTTYYFVKEKQ